MNKIWLSTMVVVVGGIVLAAQNYELSPDVAIPDLATLMPSASKSSSNETSKGTTISRIGAAPFSGANPDDIQKRIQQANQMPPPSNLDNNSAETNPAAKAAESATTNAESATTNNVGAKGAPKSNIPAGATGAGAPGAGAPGAGTTGAGIAGPVGPANAAQGGAATPKGTEQPKQTQGNQPAATGQSGQGQSAVPDTGSQKQGEQGYIRGY